MPEKTDIWYTLTFRAGKNWRKYGAGNIRKSRLFFPNSSRVPADRSNSPPPTGRALYSQPETVRTDEAIDSISIISDDAVIGMSSNNTGAFDTLDLVKICCNGISLMTGKAITKTISNDNKTMIATCSGVNMARTCSN